MPAVVSAGGRTCGPGIVGVAGALLAVPYLFVPPFKGSGPLINAIGFSGVVAIVVGIRAIRN